MTYITYSPVDAQFGCLARDLPRGAPFNGVDPIGGITFGFADYSRNEIRQPGEPVIMWGTVKGAVEDNSAILLRAVTKAEYDAAQAAEIAATKATSETNPSIEQRVDAERDRRIRAGITFGGTVFQTDDTSRERIEKARVSALTAAQSGVQAGDLKWTGVGSDFFWIALDNTRVPMDAPTTVAFGSAVAAREGLIIVAASDLKKRIAAGETIANIGDDALWP